MTNLLESIFQSYQSSWNDCQQILLTFFNTEEWQQFLTEAHCWFQRQAPAGTLEAWARKAAPKAQLTWDINTEEGQGVLIQYCASFLHRLRAGAKKPTNMS
jgi:hypothetical protein